MPRVPEPFEPGDVLRGRYVILERLGAGGYGTTYKARDRDPGRRGAPCVVKWLVPEDPADPDVGARFAREADALAKLQHAAVPTLYDSFVDGGAYYIVQQYVEGRTLGDAVDADGPLPEARARAVLRELLTVLKYLHEHDPPVVHRDIAPDNVILDRDGRVRLIDFGSVRDAVGSTGRRSRVTARPGYTSPEQALLDLVRPEVDLYAAGAVALFAVTGKDQTKWGDRVYESLRGRTGTSAAFERVLAGLLAPPGSRFESARAALAALDGPAPLFPGRGHPGRRVAQGALGTAGALGLIALGYIGAAAVDRRDPPGNALAFPSNAPQTTRSIGRAAAAARPPVRAQPRVRRQVARQAADDAPPNGVSAPPPDAPETPRPNGDPTEAAEPAAEPAAEAEPQVERQESRRTWISREGCLDVDTGSGACTDDYDLRWPAGTTYLVPGPGAKLSVLGPLKAIEFDTLTVTELRRLRYSEAPIALPELRHGVAMVSDRGNYVKLRVTMVFPTQRNFQVELYRLAR